MAHQVCKYHLRANISLDLMIDIKKELQAFKVQPPQLLLILCLVHLVRMYQTDHKVQELSIVVDSPDKTVLLEELLMWNMQGYHRVLMHGLSGIFHLYIHQQDRDTDDLVQIQVW